MPSTMWDVRGDAFESLSGIVILEVADLSIEEPVMESMVFKEAGDEDEVAVLVVDTD
jgi:hypothetical protein